jgi:GDP-4-dehydro-6-deoxy-D-mannose reductase
MRVGNLDLERDFVDVRDVARAYALAAQRAASVTRGTVFNITSGIPGRIGDILERLLGGAR